MTASNDFDRVLGEWLDEGPNRAPDRSIELAVEHARSHPRRRDPLSFLRRDPMGRRSSGLGLRPALVLAILGLLLAAIAAVGIGSRNPSVVTPLPSATVSPTASSVAPQPFQVDLNVPAGQPQTVGVVDRSGLVVEATSGTPTGESGASFPFDSVEVSNLDATTLQLGWTGFPCQTDHTLTIEPDGAMTLERPACVGATDSIAIDRILVLRFEEPIRAADAPVTLVP